MSEIVWRLTAASNKPYKSDDNLFLGIDHVAYYEENRPWQMRKLETDRARWQRFGYDVEVVPLSVHGASDRIFRGWAWPDSADDPMMWEFYEEDPIPNMGYPVTMIVENYDE